MTPRQSFRDSRMQRQEPAQRDSQVVVHGISASQFTSFVAYEVCAGNRVRQL